MADNAPPYERVTPTQFVVDATQNAPETQRDEARQLQASLDKPWEPERARFRMASGLAWGLLGLFVLTIVCSGIAITTLVIASAFSDAVAGNLTSGIDDLMLRFITTLVPYIATPLGIALGYFFRGARGE